MLGIAALLGGGRDGIEPNVCEKYNRPARQNALESVGRKRFPVCHGNEARRGDKENHDGDQLHGDDEVVRAGALANADHQNHGEHHHHQESRQVEIRARQAERAVEHRVHERGRQVDAEPDEQAIRISGKPHRHGHVGDGIFQDQVPADNPGDNFTECSIRIGISAAGDGDHRGELGVTEPGERADQRDQQKRERDGRSGARPPRRRDGVPPVHQDVEQRRLEDGMELERLARRRRAGEDENPRADNRPNAERRERPRAETLPEAVLGLVRLGDQLVNALGREQLAGQ